MNILVAGGAGYIGSHTCVELINAGHDVICADNLLNSKYEAIRRVEQITGKTIKFYKVDLTSYEESKVVFEENHIDGVIHFAGLKCVPESISLPLKYYQNNLDSVFTVIRLMKEFSVKNFVFSSSATVYGNPSKLPLTEESEVGKTTNPYGTTKYFIEKILIDLCHADPTFNVAILRYFNPVGAHPSGLIGEDPTGIPNNLVPFVTQVAIGKIPFINVNGNDYDTKDGTGVRDYIHICDLAYGHVLAINKLATNCGLVIYNLGTGHGYSVLDVIHAFDKVVGHEVPFKIAPRRPGDIATCYADPKKAREELGFVAKYGIDEMARDAWNWQKKNPNGYESE
ncbi:MAG: UDP-glucose 4-epimerase GalE [Erysipelotrichaceae bacterium]|nr:UDP-glucose 4-epimerase GalE [Erysipelotrichaceae bacterium]